MLILLVAVHLARPCHQVYNCFHPTDPLATRLEPLISARFAAMAPVNVARYAKYPLGDGQPYHLCKSLQKLVTSSYLIYYAIYSQANNIKAKSVD